MTQTAPIRPATSLEAEVLGAPVMRLCDAIAERYPAPDGRQPAIDIDHQVFCALTSLLVGEGLEAALTKIDDDHPYAGEVKAAFADLPDAQELRAWLRRGWAKVYVGRYYAAEELLGLADSWPVACVLRAVYGGEAPQVAVRDHIPHSDEWAVLREL